MSTANESGLPEEPAERPQPAGDDAAGPAAAPEPALEAAPASAGSQAAEGLEARDALDLDARDLDALDLDDLDLAESADAGGPAQADPADPALAAAVAAAAEAARERAVFDELVASFHTETAPDPVPRRIIRHTVLNAPEWSEPIIEPSEETTVDKYFPSEHFEPPEPPPLPEASGATKASWTLLVGGVLFLLLRTLLGWETPPWMFWLALASILGGILSLFARMRPERDEYDDPDHGAVV